MRLELGAALAVLLALGACAKGGDKDEGKAEQNQARASSPQVAAGAKGVAARLNAGEWEMVVETSGMAAAGMPPEFARMMKGMKLSTRSCITPEESDRPNVFAGKADGNCSYQDHQYSGGRLHATIVCTEKSGGKTRMTSDGSIGGNSFDMRSKIETDADHHGMNIESHVTGRRLGECTGTSH